MGRHACEIGGGQRYSHDRMRQHKDQPRKPKDCQTGGIATGRERSDVSLNNPGDLSNEDHPEHPAHGLARTAKPDSSPGKVGTICQSSAAPKGEKNTGLGCHSSGRGPGQDHDHSGIPLQSPSGVDTGKKNGEGTESHHGHDVVQCWSPGERTENLARIQNLTQEAIERIKKNLGKAPISKGCG